MRDGHYGIKGSDFSSDDMRFKYRFAHMWGTPFQAILDHLSEEYERGGTGANASAMYAGAKENFAEAQRLLESCLGRQSSLSGHQRADAEAMTKLAKANKLAVGFIGSKGFNVSLSSFAHGSFPSVAIRRADGGNEA